jgi:hypothetical protein
LANEIADRTEGGQQMIVRSGFSPFFFSPYTQFSGNMFVLDANDYSTYHALELQLERRLSSGLIFQSNYTFAKSLDTRSFDPAFTRVSTGAVQSASSTPFDLRDRRLNYARSDFDRTHVWASTWGYELPFGKGKLWGNDWHPAVERLIGGWEAYGILILSSGRPFTVYSGSNTVSNVAQSPASCNGCSRNTGSLQFDPTAGTEFLFNSQERASFFTPPPGQLGNTTRNFFNTPPDFSLDMTLIKRTRITETHNVEFRLEMQNVLNTPAFSTTPNSAIITSSLFGRMRGSVSSGPRRMQLALKYNF